MLHSSSLMHSFDCHLHFSQIRLCALETVAVKGFSRFLAFLALTLQLSNSFQQYFQQNFQQYNNYFYKVHQIVIISAMPQVFGPKSQSSVSPIELHVLPFEPYKMDQWQPGGVGKQRMK